MGSKMFYLKFTATSYTNPNTFLNFDNNLLTFRYFYIHPFKVLCTFSCTHQSCIMLDLSMLYIYIYPCIFSVFVFCKKYSFSPHVNIRKRYEHLLQFGKLTVFEIFKFLSKIKWQCKRFQLLDSCYPISFSFVNPNLINNY